jgi:hypothetical protein
VGSEGGTADGAIQKEEGGTFAEKLGFERAGRREKEEY